MSKRRKMFVLVTYKKVEVGKYVRIERTNKRKKQQISERILVLSKSQPTSLERSLKIEIIEKKKIHLFLIYFLFKKIFFTKNFN
jgi:hypothetical protein